MIITVQNQKMDLPKLKRTQAEQKTFVSSYLKKIDELADDDAHFQFMVYILKNNVKVLAELNECIVLALEEEYDDDY